ncbi:TPA: putative toxin-antitoxin system toxin component, PIN family [Candidatus Poribacteria bacterium]|nr:putative toxin-antitoxin system toxin component, PIN family [Candidatus Poribacteria bacterium]
MIKVVFDTSVLVSAFLSSLFPDGGLSSELFHLGQSNQSHLYIAEPILEEVRYILLKEKRIRSKYFYTSEDVEEFLQSLKLVSHFIDSVPNIFIVERDPNDNKILACAVAINADYLVTCDLDLLDIGSYKGIKIVKPEYFIHLVRNSK